MNAEQYAEYQVAIAQIELGQECEKFLSSDVGRYIVGVAEREIQGCAERILNCDPEDAHAIRQLQFEARTAQNVMRWLEMAIVEYRHAFESVSEIEGD